MIVAIYERKYKMYIRKRCCFYFAKINFVKNFLRKKIQLYLTLEKYNAYKRSERVARRGRKQSRKHRQFEQIEWTFFHLKSSVRENRVRKFPGTCAIEQGSGNVPLYDLSFLLVLHTNARPPIRGISKFNFRENEASRGRTLFPPIYFYTSSRLFDYINFHNTRDEPAVSRSFIVDETHCQCRPT